MERTERAPWTVSLREFSVNGYVAVVLASEAQVREEWRAMRNCAADYVAGCAEDTHRLISLHDRETGERLTTIVLRRKRGRYDLVDARRRFNRPAGPELWSVAERAAAIYASACAASPMRRATHCRRTQRPPTPCSSELPTGLQEAFDFGMS